MNARAERFAAGLADLDRHGLRRSRRVLESPQGPHVRVDGRTLVNFSSNDYLGLANHPCMREAAHAAIDRYGVGAGASPLVAGHLEAHCEAERRFAAFSGLPRALLFGSGYAANLGILASFADREAEIFSDELNHACLIDGARLSRARVTRYPHCDVAALGALLDRSEAAVRIVATDAVFSMDGDIAPMPELTALCERTHDAPHLREAHGALVIDVHGRTSL
jgi:8-amino-7-oxononanoate synthase